MDGQNDPRVLLVSNHDLVLQINAVIDHVRSIGDAETCYLQRAHPLIFADFAGAASDGGGGGTLVRHFRRRLHSRSAIFLLHARPNETDQAWCDRLGAQGLLLPSAEDINRTIEFYADEGDWFEHTRSVNLAALTPQATHPHLEHQGEHVVAAGNHGGSQAAGEYEIVGDDLGIEVTEQVLRTLNVLATLAHPFFGDDTHRRIVDLAKRKLRAAGTINTAEMLTLMATSLTDADQRAEFINATRLIG